MLINRISAGLLLLLVAAHGWAQDKDFRYRRKIISPAEGWYSLALPADLFHSVNRELTDLRIYALTGTDTLEIPYLVKVLDDAVEEDRVDLDVFNKSEKDGMMFLTFELKSKQNVNRLELEFEELNFNGFVQLSGSPDQREWFVIDTQQRILSFDKDEVHFKSTALNFPVCNYRYLRVRIQADAPLTFRRALIKKRETKYGVHHQVPLSWNVTNDKKGKETILDVTMHEFQPVSSVRLEAAGKNDFYRSMTIETLRDSSRTPRGWMYSYDHVYSGTLTSWNDNTFDFPYALTKKMKITIRNADNAPLEVKKIAVTGPQIELATKLTIGEFYVYYGNSRMGKPSYDLIHFTDKIPPALTAISSGQEESLKPAAKSPAFFESKLWLWAIMGIAIGVLGFFTLKMMKSKA